MKAYESIEGWIFCVGLRMESIWGGRIGLLSEIYSTINCPPLQKYTNLQLIFKNNEVYIDKVNQNLAHSYPLKTRLEISLLNTFYISII